MTPGGAYQLRRALELLLSRDGDAYLLRGGSGQEHVIRRPDQPERELLARLADGPVEIEAGSAAMRSIQPLIDAGAVIPAWDAADLGPADAERFDRQLPYLEDLGDPVRLQRRLRAASVAVIGCGGLGTWALAALVCAGVGRLRLIDDDVIEPSNLNRQILYGPGEVGELKVQRAAAWARRFNPAIVVDADTTAVQDDDDLDRLAGCDAWILTADRPPYELARRVNSGSLRHGVPFITAGQQPPLIKVGPFYRPGAGACYACHEQQLRASFPLHDELASQRQDHPPPAATLGPASALVGAMLATEVMHQLLSGQPPATAGRMRIVDIRTLDSTWAVVRQDPGCEACGVAR